MMDHGDAREGNWRWNWWMEWVASTLHTTSEQGVSSITIADAHTSAASSRLNWLPPADLNGLVRFAGKRNLVSAHVPSHFKRSLPASVSASAVVMLDTSCSEVVWRVLDTHSIRQFPLQFPCRASQCAITFQLDSTSAPFPRCRNIYKWQMCVRYSSLGNVAVDSVAPHKIFRLEKLLVTHPLEILSLLWKLQV